MNFMIFFFVFFGQFLVSVLYALGIGSMGSAGIITGLEQFGGSGGQIVVGVLMLLNGIGFGVAAAADFYLLVKIHKMYRSTGTVFINKRIAKQISFSSSSLNYVHDLALPTISKNDNNFFFRCFFIKSPIRICYWSNEK